jgi:hypothetical protein
LQAGGTTEDEEDESGMDMVKNYMARRFKGSEKLW